MARNVQLPQWGYSCSCTAEHHIKSPLYRDAFAICLAVYYRHTGDVIRLKIDQNDLDLLHLAKAVPQMTNAGQDAYRTQ